MALPKPVKTALFATAGAFALVIVGGIAGFLSHAYLEIWFETVDGVKLTDFSTWPKIAEGLSASFDVTSPQSYRAYYGENMGGGRTAISQGDFVLKDFEMTGKVVGVKNKSVSGKQVTYTISGYVNADHMVLTQRGPLGGVGTYFLTRTQDATGRVFFFGNFLTEDIKEPGGNETWITQCPIVMTTEALADRFYPTPDAAAKAFGFLQTKCSEYRMPASLAAQL